MQTISLVHSGNLYCPFCKKKFLTNPEEDRNIEKSICKHVLYIYDNDGYLHYLSDEVKDQLKSKGYDLSVIEKLLIEDEYDGNFDKFDLSEILEYPHAFEFEIESPGMTGVYTFVALKSC